MLESLHTYAKVACEASGWKLTNLELQKILFIAQMIHLGQHGEPLIDGAFEAWDLGPVYPELYHLVKHHGRSPVKDDFYLAKQIDDDPKTKLVRDLVQSLSGWTAGQLVSFTHEQHGAWAKNYLANKGSRISNEDIVAEYEWRQRRARA